MIFWMFCPKSWGSSPTRNLTCMFQPINKIHPGRVSSFQTQRMVKGIHLQLSFDAVKTGALIRVTFDDPFDNE